jgi:Tol biopolymer transport system component
MICRLACGLLLLGACKAELADGPTDGGSQPTDGDNSQPMDAAVDGQAPLGPWGTPQKVPGADSALGEDDVALSSTRLELYFKRSDNDSANLYVMTRATPTSAWGAPTALTVLNSNVDEESPRLTQDDLTMYFGRDGDIYKTTRTAVGQPWGAPTAVGVFNTGAYEKWAVVCPSGYAMVSRAVNNRGQDLFEGDITTGANTAVDQLNSTSNEQGTFLSSDCLRVYFQSDRSNNQFDIYMASRVTMTTAWSNATVLSDFNTTGNDEEDPGISADQRTFVFASDASGNKDIYISTR